MLPVTTGNRIDEEIPKRGGTEGGIFTGRIEDSGPRSVNNSVEEKTLQTRQKGINMLTSNKTLNPELQTRNPKPKTTCTFTATIQNERS
jgi:hypothetical protein